MSATDARLWHPWLRINRMLRVMLRTRWSAETWAVVRVEFRKTLALRSQIRRVRRESFSVPKANNENSSSGARLCGTTQKD
jgi:hypothetical protein